MLFYHFLIAYRQLVKSKLFSFINIIGLTISLTASFLIVQYISFEWSYDNFHKNKNEIYRVAYKKYKNGIIENTSSRNLAGLTPWIKDNFSEVKACTQFWKIPANSKFLIEYNQRIFSEPGTCLVVDSTFFNVFPSLLLKGNPGAILKNEHSLIISERAARKIFGKEDALGKVIAASSYNQAYEITGIIKDLPENSHLSADFIWMHNYQWDDPQYDWDRPSRFVYFTLAENTDVKQFEDKLNRAFDGVEKIHKEAQGVQLVLQPLTEIHLLPSLGDELKSPGNKNLLYVLSAIAIIIVFASWINYINLTTSQLVIRAKEVGIRRVIGSSFYNLVVQFFVEYACLTFIAIFFAASLIYIIEPYFVRFIDIQFELSLTSKIVLIALGIFLLGSLIVGTYPVLLLSRLRTTAILKGKTRHRTIGYSPTKLLVVFQYVASMILLGFVIVVFNQIKFMQQANKKIQLEQVIAINNPTVYSASETQEEGSLRNFLIFKNKLGERAQIYDVSSSSALPGSEVGFTYIDLLKRNLNDAHDPSRYKVLFIDYNFIPLYGLKLLKGRNYSEDHAQDKAWQSIILNEASIKALGFNGADEAIDQEVYFMVDDVWEKYKIIGIVEDYHHEALKKEIKPMILFLNQNKAQQNFYSVKLQAGANMQQSVELIEKVWREVFPAKPFEYFFLDEYYDLQFKSEVRFGRIFGMFSAIAVFIAALGILSMSLFEGTMRYKEISIRKVLGATILNIISLLSKDYFKLILLSTLIFVPVFYYCATTWLLHYPSRITIHFRYYIIPFVVMIFIVLITSAYQTIRAATIDPARTLKNE